MTTNLPKHSTMYLFGIEPHELEDMSYPLALRYKKDMGKELYYLLADVEPEFQDEVRMFWILDAIKHTEKLLNELEEER